MLSLHRFFKLVYILFLGAAILVLSKPSPVRAQRTFAYPFLPFGGFVNVIPPIYASPWMSINQAYSMLAMASIPQSPLSFGMGAFGQAGFGLGAFGLGGFNGFGLGGFNGFSLGGFGINGLGMGDFRLGGVNGAGGFSMGGVNGLGAFGVGGFAGKGFGGFNGKKPL